MIPRRYVIAGLGIGLAIVLAVILRPNRSDDAKPSGRARGERLNRRERRARSGIRGRAGRRRRGSRRCGRGAGRGGGHREAPRGARRGEGQRRLRPEDRSDDELRHRLGRLKGSELELRRLGASGRDRPEGAVRLPPHHALRRAGTAATHCPTPWIPLTISDGRRRDLGPAGADLPVRRSKAAVRPDHRGRARTPAPSTRPSSTSIGTTASRRSSRNPPTTARPGPTPVHVYGNVSWTDKPEITIERLREGRLRLVERAAGRRPLRRHLPRLRRDVDAAEAQRRQALLLRLRRPRPRRRDGHLLGIEQSSYSGRRNVERRGVAPRRHLPRQGHDVAERHRREGATRRELHRRRVQPRLLHRARPRSWATRRVISSSRMRARRPTRGHSASTSRRRRTRGRTWSAGVPLSVTGENATEPRLASSGGGNVRIWYMQTAGARSRRLERLVPELVGRRRELVVPGEDQRRARRSCRLRRRETASARSTGTTARSRSRTPARRSPPGARGSATRAPAAPGSTSSAEPHPRTASLEVLG